MYVIGLLKQDKHLHDAPRLKTLIWKVNVAYMLLSDLHTSCLFGVMYDSVRLMYGSVILVHISVVMVSDDADAISACTDFATSVFSPSRCAQNGCRHGRLYSGSKKLTVTKCLVVNKRQWQHVHHDHLCQQVVYLLLSCFREFSSKD